MKSNTSITLEEYAQAAQKIVDLYPPEILEKLFSNAALWIYTSSVEGCQRLNSTGQFWSRLPGLFPGIIHCMGGNALNQLYPTLQEWETALATAIKQGIIDQGLK